jgi:uncharacterized membrane protein
MLKKALRHIDEGVSRLAVLALRSFVWPIVVSIAAGSGAWMIFHQDRLGLYHSNKLPEPERLSMLWWVGPAFVGVLLIHAIVGLVVRIRTGAFQSMRVTHRVNQATSFLIATPFVAALMTPHLESKRAILTMFYVIVAGLCFVPTLMLMAREPLLDEPLTDPGWRERIGRYLVPLVLVLMFAGYGLFFSNLAITHHHALGTRTIDLGYYDNIFYQSIHGRPLACSFLKAGHHGSAHFDPILVVLSPLYLLYPRAELLLVLQSFWLASGVFPAYLIGRDVLRSRYAGLVIAAVYALHPALHGANMYEFHSLTLIAPPVIWALYFLETGRTKAYWGTLALLLLIREDVPLLMCFVAAYAILSRRPGYTRLGWVTVIVCLAYFGFVKTVFMTSADILNAGPESYGFSYYYREMIPNKTGFRGMLVSLFTNPSFVLKHIFEEEKVEFLLQLFVPMALLPLFAKPGRFMLLYGSIFTLLATRKPVYQVGFQYAMLLLPVMVSLTPVGLRRLQEGRAPGLLRMTRSQLTTVFLGGLIVLSLLTSWRFGGLWKNEAFRGGFSRVVRELNDKRRERYEAVKEMVDKIEPGAGVTVTNKTGPHVSNRKHVYLYRQKKVKESHYVFIDLRDLKGRYRAWHDRRVKRGELELVQEHQTIKLYRFHPEYEHRDAAPGDDEGEDDLPKKPKPSKPKPTPKPRPAPKPKPTTTPKTTPTPKALPAERPTR